MRRRAALMIAMGFGFLGIPAAPSSATSSDIERQTAALPKVKNAVTKATGHADKELALSLKDNQLWLTITNSSLNKASAREREAQATQIVEQISQVFRMEAAFAGTLGIHIDYVDSKGQSGPPSIIDSIDFRKNPQGQFIHHTT